MESPDGVTLDVAKAEEELSSISDDILLDFRYLEFALQTVHLLLRSQEVSEALTSRQPHSCHPLHSSTFLASTLQKYAVCILNFQCTETDLPIGHKALVEMVQVAKYYLFFPHPDPTIFPAILRLLREIFNDKRPFYPVTYPNHDGWPYVQEIVRKNVQFAQEDAPLFHYVRYHELLFYCGNIFGVDGFSEVVLSIDRLRVPFSLLQEIVLLFQCFGMTYTRYTRSKVIAPLRDAVFQVLLRMTEEDLRPLNNVDIDRIVATLETLEQVGRRVHSKPYETFLLQFAVKCLRTSILPKRLHGIDIIDQIALASLQQEQLRMYHDVSILAESCVTPSELATWLVENEILEIIFGKGTHEELIRRSKDILILLAKENALSDEGVDMVWDRGK